MQNWVKASASQGISNCVELSRSDEYADGVAIRDSKQQGQGPVLDYTADEFRAFLDGAKQGEFDHLI